MDINNKYTTKITSLTELITSTYQYIRGNNATNDVDSNDQYTSVINAILMAISASLIVNIIYLKVQSDPLLSRVIRINSLLARLLIRSGISINRLSIRGEGALYQAIKQRQSEIVDLLLAKGADINQMDSDGWSQLQTAIYQKDEEVAKGLIAKGADIHRLRDTSKSPLYLALKEGLSEVVDLLLTKGADINQADSNGWSQLQRAIILKDEEVAKGLIAKGADIHRLLDDGRSAVYLALEEGLSEVVDLLLTKGADINQADSNGWSQLQRAIILKDEEVAKGLIAKGADIHRLLDDGRSAVYLALEQGLSEVVDLLLTKGADINQMDSDGMSQLVLAMVRAKYDIVEGFIDKGANVRQTLPDGRNLLYLSIKSGHAKTKNRLLRQDPSLMNQQTVDGSSQLHLAAKQADVEVVDELLNLGSSPNIRNRYDQYPWNVSHYSCVQNLLAVADKDHKAAFLNQYIEGSDWSLLIYTMVQGDLSFLKTLLNLHAQGDGDTTGLFQNPILSFIIDHYKEINFSTELTLEFAKLIQRLEKCQETCLQQVDEQDGLLSGGFFVEYFHISRAHWEDVVTQKIQDKVNKVLLSEISKQKLQWPDAISGSLLKGFKDHLFKYWQICWGDADSNHEIKQVFPYSPSLCQISLSWPHSFSKCARLRTSQQHVKGNYSSYRDSNNSITVYANTDDLIRYLIETNNEVSTGFDLDRPGTGLGLDRFPLNIHDVSRNIEANAYINAMIQNRWQFVEENIVKVQKHYRNKCKSYKFVNLSLFTSACGDVSATLTLG
ncbi:MAG: ankyrin repeat domain-containing protein [Pseudomonadota bacterium]|nr:ankyrin repeat domain-containing protein [Pseudomonadota bacterium]